MINQFKAVIENSAYWKQLLGIDLRTLALFRIMLAVTCMTEVFTLWPDSFAFFDDRGLFPRAEAFHWNPIYYWSLYYINGQVFWAHCLLICTFLANIALLFGYYTRVAIVISWVLNLSLSTRLVIFTSGAHMLLPIFLFWAMFLPLGARFSIDAALSKAQKLENAYISAGTFAMMLQIALVYLFSALLKTDPIWYKTGDAIYYVLNTNTINTSLGIYLASWPSVLHSLTFYVYYLELIAILFLFSPIKNVQCRLTILPLLISLHLGFALFLTIGFFPLVCLTGLVVFIPGVFWNKVVTWFNERPARKNVTLYYDEKCDFCRKVCLIFKELGLPNTTRVLPAQQFSEIYAIMQRDNTWVVEDNKKQHYVKWEAVSWCWRRSPLLWPLGILFWPRIMHPIGNFLYHLIAKYRGALGNFSAFCLAESEKQQAFQPWIATQVMIILLSCMLVNWNIGTWLNKNIFWQHSVPAKIILGTLGLEQRMNFFAPFPNRTARWIMIEGTLENNRIVDVLHNTLSFPSHNKPLNGYASYANHYWYKYYSRINFLTWQKPLGNYYCSFWKTKHPKESLKNIHFYVYEQETPGLHEPIPLVRKIREFSYLCN